MLIFIYPIFVIFIALLYSSSKRYPKLIALATFSAILGLISLLLVILNMIDFLNLEGTIFYDLLNSFGFYLYVFSVFCLLLHFIFIPICNYIKLDDILFIIKKSLTNLLSLAVIILLATFIADIIFKFPGEDSVFNNVGYLLSLLLFALYIINMLFKNTGNKVTLSLIILFFAGIISFLSSKVFNEYEVYISYVTNTSIILFFIIIIIHSYKRIFR